MFDDATDDSLALVQSEISLTEMRKRKIVDSDATLRRTALALVAVSRIDFVGAATP